MTPFFFFLAPLPWRPSGGLTLPSPSLRLPTVRPSLGVHPSTLGSRIRSTAQAPPSSGGGARAPLVAVRLELTYPAATGLELPSSETDQPLPV
jgi:hypothetical protein